MSETAELAALLAELGVRRGGTLLVHASLGGSGWRDTEVRDALLAALGPEGTLVVPAFTPENSDTSSAHRRLTAGMTERQKAAFRAAMPPFVPRTSGCPSMGRLAECVRTTPGAVRSTHPQTSFAALGPRAAALLDRHHPHCHLGELSPLARLYEADAHVLLLRVGFTVCSAFHLAEYRMVPPPALRTYRCVVRSTGNWIAYRDVVLDDSDFGAIGAALPRGLLAEGEVAGKPVALCRIRELVDHGADIMSGFRRGMTGNGQLGDGEVGHIVHPGRGNAPR
ncbi:MAG: AAC(3) family N-acetyltransferase [Streptomyces sp.]|nr:AAC(3) family N-acetyltransferase [Streptomyces sp.]